MYWMTVTLLFPQSSQNCEAENFRLRTPVTPGHSFFKYSEVYLWLTYFTMTEPRRYWWTVAVTNLQMGFDWMKNRSAEVHRAHGNQKHRVDIIILINPWCLGLLYALYAQDFTESMILMLLAINKTLGSVCSSWGRHNAKAKTPTVPDV